MDIEKADSVYFDGKSVDTLFLNGKLIWQKKTDDLILKFSNATVGSIFLANRMDDSNNISIDWGD